MYAYELMVEQGKLLWPARHGAVGRPFEEQHVLWWGAERRHVDGVLRTPQ